MAEQAEATPEAQPEATSEAPTEPAAKTEQPAPEAPAPEPEAGTAPETPESGEKGTKFTAFDDPAVNARFKRVYRNMKENERALEEMGKFNRQLLDRLNKLESDDGQSRIQDLRKQHREAMESGDYDRAEELNDQLLDAKLEERERAAQGSESVPDFKPAPAGDFAHQDRLGSWAAETNGEGQPLRPWAQPGHPQHQRALSLIQSAAMHPDVNFDDDGELTESGMNAMLAYVDQEMGMKGAASPAARPAPAAAAVLSGNSSGPAARGSSPASRLTPEQLRVADAMNISPEDYAKYVKEFGGSA